MVVIIWILKALDLLSILRTHVKGVTTVAPDLHQGKLVIMFLDLTIQRTETPLTVDIGQFRRIHESRQLKGTIVGDHVAHPADVTGHQTFTIGILILVLYREVPAATLVKDILLLISKNANSLEGL